MENYSSHLYPENTNRDYNDEGNDVSPHAKTVPTTPETYVNSLRMSFHQFKASYPPVESSECATSAMGSLKECKFYISDKQVIFRKGMAFCVAYNNAILSTNNKNLCTSVGSMLYNVYGTTEFSSSIYGSIYGPLETQPKKATKSSMEEALNGIGVKPLVVSLPSQAFQHKIVEANVPQFDMPTILVYFACCVLHIFKKNTDETNYKTFMSSCIRDLRDLVGCDPDAELDIPFDFKRANAIRIMLGSNSKLREDIILFLVKNVHRRETGIGGVCQYLCNVLSWSEMQHFNLINVWLVNPQSPVLDDFRVAREVENLTEACKAIASHSYPQFYMYFASNEEKLNVEASRFPTLIAVAQELEREDSNGSNSETILTVGVNPTIVAALVKLHRSSMSQESEMEGDVRRKKRR